jgi:hypothetical protein
MSSSGFSHCSLNQDHPADVGGILNSSGLATVFARLEVAGLFFLACLAGESPGDASCQLTALRPSIAVEWDLLAADTSARPAAHSLAAGDPSIRKRSLSCVDAQPTAQHAPTVIFRTTMSFNKT